ncbi:MAG: dTDP-4-dehydrorhamnose reductase [Planctomycetota bacterium]|nr:dTDP-4-dehydrorhamnose reductase [Planctomycetota bacterium]
MKAIVIGGSGQIGGWLLHSLRENGHESVGTYCTVAYPGLVRLDGVDLEGSARWLRTEKPDVVFFPAGFTWVDGCEKDPAKARGANLDQPLNLARVAADLGAKFVYYSTDYLFDGRRGPYDERATPNPLSVYGQAKLEAEQELISLLGDRVLIARTSWVFGPERQGKNFAYQLVKTLRAGKTLTVPSDQVSSPSYGPDVASATVRLIEDGHSGIFHVVGPEVMSRVTFARAIAEEFGLEPSLIQGKATAEMGQGAPRPLDGGLLASRLDLALPGAMRSLATALADFRETLRGGGEWANPS